MPRLRAGDRLWVKNTEYITEPEWGQAIALSFDATHVHAAWLSTGERFSALLKDVKRFKYWHQKEGNRNSIVLSLWNVSYTFTSAEGKTVLNIEQWVEFDSAAECVNYVYHWLAVKKPFVHKNLNSIITARPAERNPVTGGWKSW